MVQGHAHWAIATQAFKRRAAGNQLVTQCGQAQAAGLTYFISTANCFTDRCKVFDIYQHGMAFMTSGKKTK